MGKDFGSDSLTRVAACVAAAVALVYVAESLCQGKDWPLWQKYGPWIRENKLQAIAIVAVILYGASLALFPKEAPPSVPPPHESDGFTACS